MKEIIKISAISILILLSCTEDFEKYNTDPTGVTKEQLEYDNMIIGSKFASIIEGIMNTTHWWYQTGQNLSSDSWCRYLATTNPFLGNRNNTTYRLSWQDSHWKATYDKVMAPSQRVIEIIKQKGDTKYEEYGAWIKLLRVFAISRLTTLHGPLIYSQYGATSTGGVYDSEKELYNYLFADLDSVIEVLSKDDEYEGFIKFDKTYGGKITKWIRFTNTLRLRLAMRISNVDPDLAKNQAEKACANSYGVMVNNNDNFNVFLSGVEHPLATICFDWNDTRMSAAMESFMVGYKDGRLSRYFEPVKDSRIDELCSDHKELPYKGIRNGAELGSKEFRLDYSTVNESFKSREYHPLMTASECHFMLAEAKLRGWNVSSESIKSLYEKAIKLSFNQWDARGGDEYVKDNTSKPLDYTDPIANKGVNAFASRSDITIAWDEVASLEEKLERIVTQKWISGFPDSFEPWTDFRRTGYPKLPYNYVNNSSENDGIVPDDDFIKRMRFVPDERIGNPDGVKDATQKLGGADLITTPLWWDVD